MGMVVCAGSVLDSGLCRGGGRKGVGELTL